MAYLDRDKPDSVQKFGGIVAFIVAGLVAKFLVGWVTDWYNHRPAKVEATLDQTTRTGPFAEALTAIKTDFPGDFGLFRQEMIRVVGSGASSDQVALSSHTWMANWAKSHGSDLAHAPTGSLREYLGGQERVMKTLQNESSDMCGRFVRAGLASTDRPSPEATVAVAHLVTVKVHAIRAGIDHPVPRSIDNISDVDSNALFSALKRSGVGEGEFALLQPEKLAAAPSDAQCAFGLKLAAAVKSLPPNQSARVIAMMAASG